MGLLVFKEVIVASTFRKAKMYKKLMIKYRLIGLDIFFR